MRGRSPRHHEVTPMPLLLFRLRLWRKAASWNPIFLDESVARSRDVSEFNVVRLC